MKFKNCRLEFEDPEGDQLTADVYHNDGEPSTGFLIIVVGRARYSRAVRMSRKEAKKFAKGILKQVKERAR